jgi:hypothetical protein
MGARPRWRSSRRQPPSYGRSTVRW